MKRANNDDKNEGKKSEGPIVYIAMRFCSETRIMTCPASWV